ncbi:GntR family transcriptional regulator [Pseudooceanicola algae]|uniref:Uncharacterized protein n=1 Tax=Pseudooceanicola algae TaxID=1537215 RepID=A0A418SGJ9_9RHOB|nr:GntR family transcriptional regulator [Pseudooceanicola algae]QPM91802.1 hypothetical protein PSAL_030570 [Pseudooceanicola algae]
MRATNEEIAAVLRERICLFAGPGDMLLHEGQLAAEFGVSRTPIRQVLQMLAYESLVETRSGVGTIVSPLLPERRRNDEIAFRALLSAAASCPVPGRYGLDEAGALLRKARVLLRAEGPITRDRLFHLLEHLLDATAILVDDHILVAAMRASCLRYMRWVVTELPLASQDAEAEYAEWLEAGIRLAVSAPSADLLRHLARRKDCPVAADPTPEAAPDTASGDADPGA